MSGCPPVGLPMCRDLPGCVAAGETRQETERLIREAIAFHIEGLREENDPIPEPSAWAEAVEV